MGGVCYSIVTGRNENGYSLQSGTPPPKPRGKENPKPTDCITKGARSRAQVATVKPIPCKKSVGRADRGDEKSAERHPSHQVHQGAERLLLFGRACPGDTRGFLFLGRSAKNLNRRAEPKKFLKKSQKTLDIRRGVCYTTVRKGRKTHQTRGVAWSLSAEAQSCSYRRPSSRRRSETHVSQ